jgi:hypothetical protein
MRRWREATDRIDDLGSRAWAGCQTEDWQAAAQAAAEAAEETEGEGSEAG